MNISSVLIIAKPDKHEDLLKEIAAIEHCSVELVEGEKIIALIESENLDDELKAYKALEKLRGASAVSMVFSYQDLDEDMQKIKGGVPKVLQDELNAEDIEYHGDIAKDF